MPKAKSKISSFKKKFKQAPLYKKIFGILSLLALLGFIFLVVLILSVRGGMFGKLPTYAELKAVQNPEAARIFSKDGAIIGKYFIKNRTSIEYDQISPFLTGALVATEDARFYKHNGIDLRAWARVGIKTILLGDKSAGGGSTITQQLAKNLFPRKNYSLLSIPVNKIREFILARRFEKIYSKKEILNLYLNTVPFGSDIFGVQVAAKQLFGTNPNDIKLEDAAVLVGMLKANTKYHPARNPKNSKNRRNVVLSQMVKYDYLKQVEYDSLKQLPLNSNYVREQVHSGKATYFREHLRHEVKRILKENDLEAEYNLYTDGLKIYTTINSKLQDYAEQAVAKHMSGLQETYKKHWGGKNTDIATSDLMPFVRRSKRYKTLKAEGRSDSSIMQNFKKKTTMTIFDWKEGEKETTMTPLDSVNYYVNLLNAGFLAVNPKNGEVLAWVGGISQKHLQYDHVKSKRPVGSTFKPIVYTTALTQGIPPCDYIYNRLVNYSEYDDWQPKNSDGNYQGVYSMEGGLTNSVNTISVDLIMRTGTEAVVNLAKEMGVTSPVPNVPSIALGTPELTLYEMVNVYATIANMGKRPDIRYINKIENKAGEVIYESEKTEESAYIHVLDTLTTQMVTRMMRSVVDNGTGRRLRNKYGFTIPIAGKTGTTQNHSDGYFIGFTPDFVGGVWVGGEIPKVRFKTISLGAGGNMALPIWAEFLQASLKDNSFNDWNYNKFIEMPDSMAVLMNCEHYLEAMPVLAELEDELEEIDDGSDDSFEDKIGDLIEKIKNKKKDQAKVEEKSDRKYPTRAESQRRRQIEKERREAYEKAKKKREKFEKKKNKKKKGGFFDRVFGG